MDEFDRTAHDVTERLQFSAWDVSKRFVTASRFAAAFRSAAAEREHELQISIDALVAFWRLHPEDLTEEAIRAVFKTSNGAAADKTCTWTPDEDGVYHTACGNASVFDNGTPAENQHHFCGYCGARLIEKRSDE